jgi:hypothetical protein
MVLWALFSRERPYTSLDPGVVASECAKGARPELPANCPKRLGELIERCWDANPANRPAFDEILKLLDDIKRGQEGAGSSTGSDAESQGPVRGETELI